MLKKRCAIGLICFLSLCGLLSCGLEAFSYLDYIPQSTYSGDRSLINLPSSSDEGYSTYFKNFIIFYRIYTSATIIPPGMQLIGSGPNVPRSTINPTLNSDYNSLFNYTDITSTSVSTSNLETIFDNRNYYQLTLAEANITNVLGSRALGETLVIFFSTNNGVQPILTINGASYSLQRATEGKSRIFVPEPDRRFLNSPDLYDSAKAYPTAQNINADVVAASSGDIRYTYVSMYIAAKGVSFDLPPQDIYSQPAHIGIFRLVDFSN